MSTTFYGGSNNVKTSINNLWGAVNALSSGGAGTGNMTYSGVPSIGKHYIQDSLDGKTAISSKLSEDSTSFNFGSNDLVAVNNIDCNELNIGTTEYKNQSISDAIEINLNAPFIKSNAPSVIFSETTQISSAPSKNLTVLSDNYLSLYGGNINVGATNNIILNSNDFVNINTGNMNINSGAILTNSNITGGSFIKSGGTNQQYLMADGSVLQQSGSNASSNIYLYNNHSGVLTPPPTNGDIAYNNSTQDSATIVYISHLTRDSIDVEVFYQSINSLYDLYIQDQSTSVNFIRYNITGSITLVPNSYISVPVLKVDSAGTGATDFGSGHNVILSFISNLSEVDTRLSAVETKTQNQTAVSGTTTFTGNINMGLNTINTTQSTFTVNQLVSKNYVDTKVASYLPLVGGALSGALTVGNNPINTTQGTFTSGQLVSKSYVDSTVGNYLLKSGGVMTGNIDMGTAQITNLSKISTISGTFNIGFNNTNNYTSTDLNILCGNSNIINANENIIFGVSNSVTSNQTNVVGRGNTNINTGLGNVFGFFNSVISTSANVIGYNNNVGGTVAGYYSNCIGVNNILNGLYASGIGSDITNNTPNSLCLGDSAVTTIFPNSLVCDLGTSAKPYKDIYYSGEIIKASSKLDINYINSFYIGIIYQHGSGVASTFSNSLWSALGSTSSVASTYALTNNFTRQLCCANWTFPTPADGQVCGYGSTASTGIQVSTLFTWGLYTALGLADTGAIVVSQNFWGLWNASTAVPLSSTVPLSSQRNMICFGSSTADLNICIYTAGASNTVKQVDLGSNFLSNRLSAADSTFFYRLSLYWDGAKIYYKAINTTLNITVQGSFTPLSTDIPASTISLYPQCSRIMGSPNTSTSARLKVQRFGVFY